MLASLGETLPQELDRQGSRALAQEISTLRLSGGLLALDAELEAIDEVSRWCARGPRDARLRIEAR